MVKLFRHALVVIAILVMVITVLFTVNSQAGDVTPVEGGGDVSTSDPYYDALRNVVERYGINVGYPDGTFKGNQFLTRAEFVDYMNDALNQATQLTAAPTGDASLLANDVEKVTATLSSEHHSLKGELAQIKARLEQLERKLINK